MANRMCQRLVKLLCGRLTCHYADGPLQGVELPAWERQLCWRRGGGDSERSSGHVSREAEVTTAWHPVQFGGDFYLIAGMRQLPMSLLWSFRTLWKFPSIKITALTIFPPPGNKNQPFPGIVVTGMEPATRDSALSRAS